MLTLPTSGLVLIVGRNGSGRSRLLRELANEYGLEDARLPTDRPMSPGARQLRDLRAALLDLRSVWCDGLGDPLHPDEQTQLARDIAAAGVLVLGTTVSPGMVSTLGEHPERVIVCSRFGGRFRHARLSDYPKIGEAWCEGLDAGELWSVAGEDWVSSVDAAVRSRQ